MSSNKEHYGLATAISMVVGISVGSGIFFKIDDILAFAGGNVGPSALLFVLISLCVIFGSLAISQLPRLSERNEGIIGYYEEFVSKRASRAFAYFQLLIYYPTVIAVVAGVGGTYTSLLLGLESSLELDLFIGALYIVFFYAMNYLSLRLGGWFQNIATVLKIIPLLGVALLSLFVTEPIMTGTQDLTTPLSDLGWTWLGAVTPIAFSYDGWIVTTNITNEVKNSRRNVPIALTVGPLIVLFIYLSYMFGMIRLVGVDFILETGNNTIYYIAQYFLGSTGAKIIIIFVLIAVLGVVNGFVLGHIRLPIDMGRKHMLPKSEDFRQVSPKTKLSPKAAALSLSLTLLGMVLHYLTQRMDLFRGSDISEVAIVFSYIAYMVLYVQVIRLYRQGKISSKGSGLVIPILAILGALIIVFGATVSNPLYVPASILIFAGIIAGFTHWSGKFIPDNYG